MTTDNTAELIAEAAAIIKNVRDSMPGHAMPDDRRLNVIAELAATVATVAALTVQLAEAEATIAAAKVARLKFWPGTPLRQMLIDQAFEVDAILSTAPSDALVKALRDENEKARAEQREVDAGIAEGLTVTVRPSESSKREGMRAAARAIRAGGLGVEG